MLPLLAVQLRSGTLEQALSCCWQTLSFPSPSVPQSLRSLTFRGAGRAGAGLEVLIAASCIGGIRPAGILRKAPEPLLNSDIDQRRGHQG